MISMTSWVMSMSVCLSIYTSTLNLSFWYIDLKFCTSIFLSNFSPFFICRYRQYRIIIAYATQTVRSKSSSCTQSFCISWDISSKFRMVYRPRQRYNLRRNSSDRTTIVSSCHTNWSSKIQSLYGKFFIWRGNFTKFGMSYFHIHWSRKSQSLKKKKSY